MLNPMPMSAQTSSDADVVLAGSGGKKVVALVATKRTGRFKLHQEHSYNVEGVANPVVIPGPRISMVEDKRPYSHKYPVRFWLQDTTRRWGGVIGVGLGTAVAAQGK